MNPGSVWLKLTQVMAERCGSAHRAAVDRPCSRTPWFEMGGSAGRKGSPFRGGRFATAIPRRAHLFPWPDDRAAQNATRSISARSGHASAPAPTRAAPGTNSAAAGCAGRPHDTALDSPPVPSV